MYLDGKDVEQSYEKAAKYFTLAADQGNKEAQLNLGVLYYLCEGVEQSFEIAAKFFKLAANQGIAQAQLYLGVLYYKG